MSRIKYGETRFGKLTILGAAPVIGYTCACSCGETVERTEAQLRVRKMAMCKKCREEYVAEQQERRMTERNRHADHQPART